MTAFETHTHIILIPSDFTWLDDKTLLVHQGAVLLRPELDGAYGRVIGFTVLCTETLGRRWWNMPRNANLIVTCFGCLGASEQ